MGYFSTNSLSRKQTFNQQCANKYPHLGFKVLVPVLVPGVLTSVHQRLAVRVGPAADRGSVWLIRLVKIRLVKKIKS